MLSNSVMKLCCCAVAQALVAGDMYSTSTSEIGLQLQIERHLLAACLNAADVATCPAPVSTLATVDVAASMCVAAPVPGSAAARYVMIEPHGDVQALASQNNMRMNCAEVLLLGNSSSSSPVLCTEP
jgi:hypothetical protein